jgi:hypothetical protein
VSSSGRRSLDLFPPETAADRAHHGGRSPRHTAKIEETVMLRTLFTLSFVLAAAACAQAQQWGDLEADFFLKGDFKPDKIVPDKDQEYCGKPENKLVRQNVVINAQTKALANVAVYLFVAPGQKKPEVHPDYAKIAKNEIVLDNKNCRYEPHVQWMLTTQPLVLKNSDPIGHNMKAEFFNPQNPAFNDQIPANGQVTKNLKGSETAFVPVQCSIHGWMNSWLLVREDPYVGISDDKGHLSIKNVPVGEWTFVVWQENGGYVTEATVDGKATKWMRGRVKVNVKPGVNKLGKVEIAPAALKLK